MHVQHVIVEVGVNSDVTCSVLMVVQYCSFVEVLL